jgi:hypothetical protein
MKIRTIGFALFTLAALACASPARAASVTNSPVEPVIDGEDLSNFGEQVATEKWWAENSAAGSTKGETLRVRNAALRFKALTFQTTSGAQPTKVYTIRIGTVVGTNFTQVYTENATQNVAWAAGDYVTWRLATPFLLQPNTTYGIDVGMKSSSSAWQTGIPYLSVTEDELYPSGARFNSGTSGIGTASIFNVSRDFVFHMDLEKPIGPGWNLVATSPADDSTNQVPSSVMSATFSQDIGPGTGNITLRNLTDGIDTVIPVGDPRIFVSENLLTISPGAALLPNKDFAVRIDPTAITNVFGTAYPGITNDTTWNFSTGAADPLLAALGELKNHITGSTNLTFAQISAHKQTIDLEKNRFADNTSTIAATFDLVRTYDTVLGPLWVARGLPKRASVSNDLHWTIYNVMQNIMDVTFKPQNLAEYEGLMNGFRFNSSSNFPGACTPPANSNQTHTATLSADYLDTRGWATQGDGPGTYARRPTGCYLAPGSVATITVPAALVGKGYRVRVGAHSWDFSNKPDIKRLDRSTLTYSINAVETKVASPLGGGIYIEVPFAASNGIVNVQIKNAVRSPYFSYKSFHTTTPTQWLTERTNAAPWADLQSEKFMTQVPRTWVYAMPDPTQLMKDWDAAMDACNDLLGFPRIRGKESFYLQPDLLLRASVFAPGYPAVNSTYNPSGSYGGYAGHYLVRGPQYGTDDAQVEFHEQGHGYFFPKFGGETESNVNLLFVPVLQQKFGLPLDTAFRSSLGSGNTYQTLDTTAIAWMCCFSFSPNEVPMFELEKQYQLKGHAKFVDLARLYGWGVLSNYWSSFVNEYENGIAYSTATDSLLLRLSKAVGKDIRPLFHFWGIHPQNPASLAASMTNANLTPPVEIYDRLAYYKTLVPPNNSAYTNFAYKWWNKKPSVAGYWEETDHAMQWDETLDADGTNNPSVRPTITTGSKYVEGCAADIAGRVQELLDLYYPNGRPDDYSAWAAGFPGANLSDPNGDHDGDGLNNGYERMWGLNPTNALSKNPFTFNASLASGSFSYTRRDPALTGLNYTVWTSADLVNWAQDTGAIQTPGIALNGVQTVSVSISSALSSQPRLFIRMRAQ